MRGIGPGTHLSLCAPFGLDRADSRSPAFSEKREKGTLKAWLNPWLSVCPAIEKDRGRSCAGRDGGKGERERERERERIVLNQWSRDTPWKCRPKIKTARPAPRATALKPRSACRRRRGPRRTIRRSCTVATRCWTARNRVKCRRRLCPNTRPASTPAPTAAAPPNDWTEIGKSAVVTGWRASTGLPSGRGY